MPGYLSGMETLTLTSEQCSAAVVSPAKTPEFSFITPSYRVREVRIMTVRETATEAPTLLNRAEAAARFFNEIVAKSEWFDAEKECFVVAFLNRKNAVRGFNLISLGTQTAALVGVPEVLRACLVANATAFICFHNHPSGDPAPSSADVHITRALRDGAKAVTIEMQDHLVIGDPKCDPVGKGYYSFREAGIL